MNAYKEVSIDDAWDLLSLGARIERLLLWDEDKVWVPVKAHPSMKEIFLDCYTKIFPAKFRVEVE